MNTEKSDDKREVLKFFKEISTKEKDVRIGITPNHMDAYLSMDAQLPGRFFTVSEIMELLEDEKILHGIDRERIDELVTLANQEDYPIRNELIVAGDPVTEGENAYLDYKFNTSNALDLLVDEDGNIDFKELNIINNIQKGDLLAVKVLGWEGSAGLDIYGVPVAPNPVKLDVPLVASKYIELSEDGNSCFAERDGQVYLKKRIITVSPLYMVPHDVDLNTGNISFNGSVVVNGNVLSGFRVRAKEDITIMGVVEAADLIAGGDIIIKGGIKGNDRGKVSCNGELITSFIESGIVECHGRLQVNTSIVNSKITCYASISMGRKKGQIVGGEVLGAGGIECRELGSKLGVATKIIIGDKPLVRAKLESVSRELEEIYKELNQVLSGIQEHENLFNNIKLLPAEKQKPLRAILNKKEEMQLKIKEIDDRKEKLNLLFNMRCMAALKVSKYCHLNTNMTIGHSHYQTAELMMNTKFVEDFEEKAVRFTPWK